MVSKTESSFGAKLRRAQDLLTYLKKFKDYNPPRSQETFAEMSTLINGIIAINATESSQYENYKVSVANRQAAFSKKSGSIEKLLSPIKGAIEAQYGKKSTESISVSAIIKKMRATKLIKIPADPTKQTQEKTLSQSERSYGSITQYFNDIVNTLTQFSDYNPSSATLKVSALQALATQLTTLNDTVAEKVQVLKTTRTSRQTQYLELKDRVQRIKSYVKAQYGNDSNEFKLIKGLSI